uniref:Slc2a-11 n=1 Tax=Schmidtea mediterranea TaxID=79327 RepID=A0A0H3YEV0_SCHMD|nr:slc2a-11 [Schmidtea mediterranea]
MNFSSHQIYFYLLLFGVCCGPIFTGYILGFSSPTIRDLTGILSVMQMSSFASMLYIGGTIGSLFIAYVMDKWGRKMSIAISAIPAIIGWIFIIWCSSFDIDVIKYVYYLYFARILGGISCGMNMACTTVYLVEISPAAWRGTFASLNQVGITVGIFLSYLIGKYFPYGHSAIVALLITIVLFFTGISIPESPRWLINQDSVTNARNSLRVLRSKTANIEQELNDIIVSNNESRKSEQQQQQQLSLSTIFTSKYQGKIFMIIQIMLLQQFSGINAFISYADIIFTKVLANYKFFKNFAMIIGLVQVIFTIIGMGFIDRFGRKSFLKVAGVIMGISLISMTLSLRVELGALIIVSMIAYIIGFSVGWGPIPVILCTEMLPQEARSLAGSVAVLTSWIGGYIVTSAFPFVNFMIGDGVVFVIFGLVCFYSVIFVERKVPETKGMSLECIPV